MSAAIAHDDWALGRFRQMDTASFCTPRGAGIDRGPGEFSGNGVYLSEPGQTRCTAVDLSRQNSCSSMSIVSEPLHVEQLVNRRDRPPALQKFPGASGQCADCCAESSVALQRNQLSATSLALATRFRKASTTARPNSQLYIAIAPPPVTTVR